MTDEPALSAAEAFEALKQEVALLRVAVQQSLNERQTPDCSQTLGKIMRDMKEASDGMTWLVNRPAIQVSAEELASRISAAGKQARRYDQETIKEAAHVLSQATTDIELHLGHARAAEVQNRRLVQFTLGAGGAGIIVGALIAIGLLHLVPEHGAAWILGLDRWDVGQQLMASADPEQCAAIQQAVERERNSHQGISGCQTTAKRAGQDERYRVKPKWKSK